ncbi:hypothetical protein [Proteiniphilum acetatigenes]|uniref:hypothetical protein n=1 Tax=Proteiniphilum acetatigenes TaxID=294710 RepID=UPI0003A79919|nr:hypothetical protein [Proteiniphilum acetatigenes]SFL56736.1 hypothetical protein SAMN05216357_12925 [Porphyromonadaceae bacterium KH3CP3RA]
MAKNRKQAHAVYTIGHSTHTWEEFLAILQSFGIKTLNAGDDKEVVRGNMP